MMHRRFFYAWKRDFTASGKPKGFLCRPKGQRLCRKISNSTSEKVLLFIPNLFLCYIYYRDIIAAWVCARLPSADQGRAGKRDALPESIAIQTILPFHHTILRQIHMCKCAKASSHRLLLKCGNEICRIAKNMAAFRFYYKAIRHLIQLAEKFGGKLGARLFPYPKPKDAR